MAEVPGARFSFGEQPAAKAGSREQAEGAVAPASDAREMTEVDDQIVACRGWGHEWPVRKLRPGRPIPKGYVPRLADDGYIEVTETCLNGCGKTRWSVLLPGGVYDLNVVRRYNDPKNWVTFPQASGITPRSFQAEAIRRMNEEIVKLARATTAREEKAK